MLRRLINFFARMVKEQTMVAEPLLLRNRAERRAKHRL